MACFAYLLLLCFAICSLVKDAMGQNNAQVQGVDNAEQFALLCRIYNVAKNPPIHHVDFQDPFKIVNEIDALNISFAEEKQFYGAENVENSSDAQVKPTITREAAVAQAIIRRITEKAHNILEDIKNINATRDIEKVKAEFAQVVFGEGMNESRLCDGALKNVVRRADACGTSGLTHKGASAGDNLVVDFFCLCAQRSKDSEGLSNACRVQVGGKGDSHGWGDQAPMGSISMWASIKKECGNLLHQHPESTEEGHEVIRDFLKHLKSGGLYRWGGTSSESSDRKKGLLGTGMATNDGGSDLVCDGKKGVNAKKHPVPGPSPGGICVYYGEENWSENIAWLKKIRTGLKAVDALNNQTATIQRDIDQLHMLLHRAEEIYQTKQVISEIHNPVAQTNFHTAAKRLTAYSASRRNNPSHFILLFVLL